MCHVCWHSHKHMLFYINKSAGLNQGADCFLLKRCRMLPDNRGFIARDQCVNVSRKGRNGGVLCHVKGNEVWGGTTCCNFRIVASSCCFLMETLKANFSSSWLLLLVQDFYFPANLCLWSINTNYIFCLLLGAKHNDCFPAGLIIYLFSNSLPSFCSRLKNIMVAV